jgi:hypothetical protein
MAGVSLTIRKPLTKLSEQTEHGYTDLLHPSISVFARDHLDERPRGAARHSRGISSEAMQIHESRTNIHALRRKTQEVPEEGTRAPAERL